MENASATAEATWNSLPRRAEAERADIAVLVWEDTPPVGEDFGEDEDGIQVGVKWARGVGGHYSAEPNGTLWFSHDPFTYKEFADQAAAMAYAEIDHLGWVASLLKEPEKTLTPRYTTLYNEFDKKCREVNQLATERDTQEAAKDGAYLERNKLVALLAAIFPSGIKRTAIEGWSEDWHGCVYIDFPWGQASWHYHDRQAALFDFLPPYVGVWNGHTAGEKYDALVLAGRSLAQLKGGA